MEKYNVVKPENYTKEHLEYINKFKKSTDLLATQMELLFLVNDVNSKIIMGSDASAVKFGFKSGKELIGKRFADFPLEDVARCDAQRIQWDQELINTDDIKKQKEILFVFNFVDGLKARLATDRLFYHQQSNAILGVLSSAKTVGLRDFINIVPTYILRFGALGSIESMQQYTDIEGIALNEYEQEICFLFLLGWDCRQIADFMDVFRPNINPRTGDTIIKKKNYICQKLGLTNTNIENFCEYLVSLGFHTKMPNSFYSRVIGAKVLG
ncbi:MAG TPA: hypothetical protein VKR58_07550 [Aquella sp.]|nr:hypothetical protein [Aquella sp.]